MVLSTVAGVAGVGALAGDWAYRSFHAAPPEQLTVARTYDDVLEGLRRANLANEYRDGARASAGIGTVVGLIIALAGWLGVTIACRQRRHEGDASASASIVTARGGSSRIGDFALNVAVWAYGLGLLVVMFVVTDYIVPWPMPSWGEALWAYGMVVLFIMAPGLVLWGLGMLGRLASAVRVEVARHLGPRS